jgi:AP-3 complex subunit sigma
MFESVCELDLIFHFDEVHAILNEVIQGGLVVETNIHEIVAAATATARARKASVATTGTSVAGLTNAALGPTGLNLSIPTATAPLSWPRGTFVVEAISNLGNQYLGRSSPRR